VGTWTPEVEDVDAALKKGDLKFTLDGYKLKGSWVLIRTGGRWGGGDGRSWLLIKHKDEWAGELDITEFAPKSVKSGGDFEDILAADKPDVWESNRPAKGGEAGAMLAKIIERAARLRASRSGEAGSTQIDIGTRSVTKPAAKRATASRTKTAKTTKSTKTKSTRPKRKTSAKR